jgi:hypothetical protein
MPPGAVAAAEAAGKKPDVFYCLRWGSMFERPEREERGIGRGQGAGTSKADALWVALLLCSIATDRELHRLQRRSQTSKWCKVSSTVNMYPAMDTCNQCYTPSCLMGLTELWCVSAACCVSCCALSGCWRRQASALSLAAASARHQAANTSGQREGTHCFVMACMLQCVGGPGI